MPSLRSTLKALDLKNKGGNLEKKICHSFVYGQRCFVPKNHKNWLYRFGDIAKIPSKTWFFTIFTFLAFLTHPNDQKMFRMARSQFFHVLMPPKKFRQNWGTLGPKVFGPPWIQSPLMLHFVLPTKIHFSRNIS